MMQPSEDRAPLNGRYLMIMLAPYHQTPDGGIWLDKLLAQDIAGHGPHLADLVVMAPRRLIATVPETLVRCPANARFIPLFDDGGQGKVLRQLPISILRVWREIGLAKFVHSGVAGWPLPPGYYVNPIALLRGKPLIIVVESAFWRVVTQTYGLRGRIHALRRGLNEAFARWSLRRARVAIYTHEGYRESLPPGPSTTTAVLPASWIRRDDLLSQEDAVVAWDAKHRPLRAILASRLTETKGALRILEALERIEAQGGKFVVDVMGEGDLRANFEALAQKCHSLQLRVLDPVPYGAPFLQVLRSYHVALVPTIGDEQPRILYDSMSQAVAILASDTPGNRAVLAGKRVGQLLPADNPVVWANALIDIAAAPELLRKMGMIGLAETRAYSHEEMHARRADLLAAAFPAAFPPHIALSPVSGLPPTATLEPSSPA